MIDSHGKPGTAGITIGVETASVVELLVVVGVLTTVIVDTDVLINVVVSELVAVRDIVEALDETELMKLELINVEDTVDALALLKVVVTTIVDCCTVFWNAPGGSRCRTKARVLGLEATRVPTAKPFVLDLR
jgi:hypothetical protein